MRQADTSYTFSRIPDGPQNVERVYNNVRVLSDLDDILTTDFSFTDRIGQTIAIPTTASKRSIKPIAAEGYCKAVWDFKNGDMLLGEDGKTLYVRDVDRSGANMRLDSWHAISNLENEYHVPGRDAYSPWNDQLRVECAKKTERVRHGVKFTDRAFIRFNGQMADIDSSSPYFSEPFEVTLDVRFDDGLAGQAVQFLRDVTVDDKSGMNLCRMFATPLLEPYKHLTYVLYGDGGNGKGILLNTLAASLPGLTASVDSQKILGGRRGSGGFDTQQEMGKLIGALWAFDEDADTISLEQLTALKKISTGDSVTARRIQENAVSFAPRCTFIVATNNPVITTMSNAIARRFVYVRMKDGRKPSEFASLLEFRRQYGVAPFLMASCLTWLQHGDDPYYDVSVGSASDLSEAEQWLVDMICEQGYAISRNNPYSESAREHKSSISKLGLKTERKRTDSGQLRVLVVADERRFHPYREAWEKDQEQLGEASKPLPVPEPIESTSHISLSEFGFQADYVPARQDKSALNWKKQAENPAIDTSRIPDTAAYAVIPQAGYMVIDMDKAKTEGEQDGWQSLQLSVGQYGSSEFPRTYLVTTPSGGVHAYYKMPQGLSGHILNKVKAGGYNIDLRVDGLGYVIGAGSTTTGGVYEVCDLPDGDTIPELSMSLVKWLDTVGCIQHEEQQSQPTLQQARTVNAMGASASLSPLERLLSQAYNDNSVNGEPPVDMSIIPKGQRNQTLHDWLYGRLANHPDNSQRIVDDFYTRGRNSGLPDGELNTILKSVCRALGLTV